MADVIISERAIADLDEIWDYIAEDSVRSADQVIDRIHRRCLYLGDHPEIGMKRDDLQPGLRRILEGRFAIFYRSRAGVLEVVRILRGERDLPGMFGGSG
ncbi:MAG: type II toxin-antitoxin system RelE/ParE family toxin [Akkermansiaceae bacterium]|nr:type II toxin-antitoxin system RelE/ParE family toxin [Akkermansiaceae bacterium]NNM29647.1 type II toxin-antitoxin system RelE/ParE family toxin [Akkermansiaceae bacterium]